MISSPSEESFIPQGARGQRDVCEWEELCFLVVAEDRVAFLGATSGIEACPTDERCSEGIANILGRRFGSAVLHYHVQVGDRER
jgi:hypothetical protein